jgi:amphiphysin
VPVRKHIESISMIQKGSAVRQPFHTRPDSLQTKTVSHRAPSGVTKNGALPPPVPGQQQQLSPPSLDFSSKPARTTSNTSYTSYGRPSPPASTASFHTAGGSDYFGTTASRQNSQPPTPYIGTVSKTPSSVSLASAAAAVAGKKKPPPPPPKRKPSAQQYDYVIAQYNFAGEGDGDLPFREGDKIRVIKRTNSENDWWEGECRGRQGAFPANYCKAL